MDALADGLRSRARRARARRLRREQQRELEHDDDDRDDHDDRGSTTTTSGGTTSGNVTTPNFASGKCKDLAASAQKIGQDFSAAGSGTGNLSDAAKEFQAFAKEVPSEIRADVQTLADAFAKYADALKGVDLSSGQTPSAADLQKIQSALKGFNQAKLQAAEQHIQAWTQKNC